MTDGSRINHYKDAGVDSEKGDALVDWLQSKKSPFIHPRGLGSVSDGIGGFAGLFSLELSKFKRPSLVASTDGVGTKLLLGLQENKCETLGQDLVGMCVNDLYTVGATPLFFLDYYATGALNEVQFREVLSSIKSSCTACGMALLGGETAEMPGLYERGHFDLAGFVVGIVDEEHRLGPSKVKSGDVLVSLGSSGFHSNGYSLIRKWLSAKPRPDLTEKLMAPTKLYHAVPDLCLRFSDSLHALANITGGGISGNLPRVMPDNLDCTIEWSNIPTPPWMTEFIKSNGCHPSDVEEVFNLGVGMIAVVAEAQSAEFLDVAQKLQLDASILGRVVPGNGPSSVKFR
jgi:phosphoribosylformylglycinamidine cyclo-ligase